VTDDTRDGDDLFEDLDKFFAPIKDVDWDEPSEPASKQAPQEEHVAVRASQPLPDAPPGEAPPSTPSVEGQSPEEEEEGEGDEADSDFGEDDEDDEAAWYDTGVMDTIDAVDDLDEVGPSDQAVEDEADIVRIVDDETVSTRDDADDEADQAELFAGAQADVASPAQEGGEWAPGEEEPSEEELEAATEHFADSLRVMPFGDEEEVAPEPAFGAEGEPGVREPEPGFGGSHPRTITVGSEGLGGPSWQEPASMEVGTEFERRGPNADERDVPAAFLTGIVLAGVSLGALLMGKPVFAVVATIVALWAQGELFGVMVSHRYQPATAVGLVSGALVMGAAYLHGEAAMLAMFALGVVATFLWFMAVPGAHRRNTLLNVGLTLFDVAWIPLLAGYLLVTLTLNDGVGLVVTVIGLTFVFDTSAFLVGQVWGGSLFHDALAPSTSPRKSIEGTIGATLITVIVGAALVPSFVDAFQNRRVDALLLALVVAAAATFGDLAESLVKRDLDIKDMGNVLPGHGGVLDRIDSLLFVAPAAFLLFRIVLG
jgi:phosphatidate cytidylyltransferase